MNSQTNLDRPIKIAVVGDVHDQWEEEDGIALQHLGVDLVLFVGDFGNEAVSVVQAIAALDIPKAVILGNHDAWYTATDWGRSKCPYNRQTEDWLKQQLELLGHTHVGYSHLDFPELGLSVVGGRPFTWGGQEWKYGQFYQEWLGINSFVESTERIMDAVQKTTYAKVIFLGHNGPLGLGDRPEDPCGRDWQPMGGDFGDPDLAEAIAITRDYGKVIPLVAFGHMHHRLRHSKTQQRKAVHLSPERTIYLNAASVPRIINSGAAKQRNFSLVWLEGETVARISLVWVGSDLTIKSEQTLYRRSPTIVPLA